ncbi:MAG TPA: AAA family ATPase [Syntrophorhabdaceae bacterium]
MKVRNFFNEVPPSPEFVLPGFPTGSVGLLTGAPGSGKTLFAIELCCAVAGGMQEEGNLLGLPVDSRGKACYLNAEDSDGELHRMVHAIGALFAPETRKSIIRDFILDAGMGETQDILDDKSRETIIETCRNSRLIVFDTLSRFHALDESNTNNTARLMGALDRIAVETGAAVLCLDRPNPASLLAERIRWRAKLRLMEEEESRSFCENPEGGSGLDRARDKIQPHRYFTELWITDRFFSNLGTVNWFRIADGGVLRPAHLYSTDGE